MGRSSQLTSVLGENYDLLTSPAPFGVSWKFLATNLPGTGSVIQFTNTNGYSSSSAFYRTRISP